MEKQDLESGVPDSLRKNLEWYVANQSELSKKYNGKVLLIVDQNVVKVFDDMGAAYSEASKQYAAGTFSLQPCSPDPESYMVMLADPAYSVLV